MSSENQEPAFARCPPEIWASILRFTIEPRGMDLPVIREAHPWATHETLHDGDWQPHIEPWKTRHLNIMTKLKHTVEGPINAYDWSYRLVCKAWNRTLLPTLLDTINFGEEYDDIVRFAKLLLLQHDGRTYGDFVHCLHVDLPYSSYPEYEFGDTTMATQAMDATFEACPDLHELHFYAQHELLSSTSIDNTLSRLHTLVLRDSFRDTSNLFDLLVRLRALQHLELHAYDREEIHRQLPNLAKDPLYRLNSLQSLSLIGERPLSTLPSIFSRCEMPQLRHLYATGSSDLDAPFNYLDPFLRAHGINLTSLVLAHQARPQTDQHDLVLLRLCRALEQLSTYVPCRPSSFSFPTLRSLQRFIAQGFSQHRASRVGGQWEGEPDQLPDQQRDMVPFFTKLTEHASGLSFIKALDVGYHGDHYSPFLEVIAAVKALCHRRNIRFEDVEGRDLLEPHFQGPR